MREPGKLKERKERGEVMGNFRAKLAAVPGIETMSRTGRHSVAFGLQGIKVALALVYRWLGSLTSHRLSYFLLFAA